MIPGRDQAQGPADRGALDPLIGRLGPCPEQAVAFVHPVEAAPGGKRRSFGRAVDEAAIHARFGVEQERLGEARRVHAGPLRGGAEMISGAGQEAHRAAPDSTRTSSAWATKSGSSL